MTHEIDLDIEASADLRPLVALYTRISTEDQAHAGFSLRAQRDRLLAYCQARGWVVAEEYTDDGHSGRDDRRPAYQRMMAQRDRWNILLVLKMDRIHRNSRNFMGMMDNLRKWEKDFVSATESLDTSTATGRFVADILQRIAQLESEQTGERVFMGMYQAAKEGHFLGMSDPYGFRYDPRTRNLVVVPNEATVVREIFQRFYRDRWSMQVIADDLQSRGIPTKRSGRWSKRQISRVLHCPLYEGSLHWKDIVTPDNHDRIVDANLRELSKRRPRRRKDRHARTDKARTQ